MHSYKHFAHNMEKTLRQTLTLGFLLIGVIVFGQDYGFDIHNISLDEYIKMEENLESERIPAMSNHSSFNGDAQPILYKRKEKIIPDLVAFHFFKEKDSTMSYVLYEWDASRNRDPNNLDVKQSEKFIKAFVKKYNELENSITKLYGKPEIKGYLPDLKNINVDDVLEKTDVWKPNDSTEIKLYTIQSNLYEKRGAMTKSPTHRIRLYVRNLKKDKKVLDKLDEARIDSLVILSNNFLKALKNKNLKNSKEYLSDLIIEQVTEEQLEILTTQIDFEREIELVYSSVQMGLNGSVFTLLQYKHRDDQESPPKEMIKVIFDDKNKIVGIQPMKMQN